jgi:hypothetical protein
MLRNEQLTSEDPNVNGHVLTDEQLIKMIENDDQDIDFLKLKEDLDAMQSTPSAVVNAAPFVVNDAPFVVNDPPSNMSIADVLGEFHRDRLLIGSNNTIPFILSKVMDGRHSSGKMMKMKSKRDTVLVNVSNEMALDPTITRSHGEYDIASLGDPATRTYAHPIVAKCLNNLNYKVRKVKKLKGLNKNMKKDDMYIVYGTMNPNFEKPNRCSFVVNTNGANECDGNHVILLRKGRIHCPFLMKTKDNHLTAISKIQYLKVIRNTGWKENVADNGYFSMIKGAYKVTLAS